MTYSGPGGNPVVTPEDEAVTFQLAYRPRNRVLEIMFDEELDRYRMLDVTLLDGISATDGAELDRWTLSFFIGG